MRIAVVCYKDHDPKIETAVAAFGFAKDNMSDYVTKVLDFSDPRAAAEFIQKVEVGGGSDFAEAVMDGLHDAVNVLTWREEAQRIIVHITDAPPHGDDYTKRLKVLDNFPKGCPCRHNIERIS